MNNSQLNFASEDVVSSIKARNNVRVLRDGMDDLEVKAERQRRFDEKVLDLRFTV